MKRPVKLFVFAIGALIIWAALAPFISTFLIVERTRDRADAIVILSGSAVYRDRCRKAAELYRLGVAPVIYLSNDGLRSGWSAEENRNPFFVELAQRELIANGVMPEAIRVLPGYVAGTDEEAAAMAREIGEISISSLVLVTSPYHTRRALFAFEQSLAGREVAVGVVPTPVSQLEPPVSWWWTSAGSLRDVAGEYVKLAAYWTYF